MIPVHNKNTGDGTALCLEVHDLAVSKLVAAREKDLLFLAGLLQHRLAEPKLIRDRIMTLQIPPEQRDASLARLDRLQKSV
ncbi:MAG TPA: hypothetical protein VGK48_05280 [Terriglobia bacterium]